MSIPFFGQRKLRASLFLLVTAAAMPLIAEDAEGCKDHPLFNRMPNFFIAECNQSQFEAKRFPVGPPPQESEVAKSQEVEGAFYYIRYELKDGATKPSPLQTMRNFQNATRSGGGTVVAEYPGWCKAMVHESLDSGNGCILYGSTFKFGRQGKETWAFVSSSDEGAGYQIWLLEREAMKQDVAVNQLRERLDKDGFIALYINFDTGSATIQQDSMSQLEQVAKLLQGDAALKLEVGGHTDNVGTPESNQKLSDARAKSVVAAIVKYGAAVDRMTAKGYGQTKPIADNRTEDGRAKNRRVELVKQ